MAQMRRLPLKGLYNCRDLGGYPTENGRVTKFGVFLRSEAPLRAAQGGRGAAGGLRRDRNDGSAQ